MLLEGKNLAEFIKERHYQQMRSFERVPKLAIIHASSDPATGSYLKAKQAYGQDLGIAVEVHEPARKTEAILELIKKLNRDDSIDGIVVQLPLEKGIATDEVIGAIEPHKDIDGLGPKSKFDPATPTAILWLLSSYQINHKDKLVTVVGQGRLVGEPISRMLQDSGATVICCDEDTKDLKSETLKADIVVTATGQKNLIKPGMVKEGAVVIDASGDVDPKLFENESLKITPTPGGVGPVTVTVLFDNLLRAAQVGRQI
ncbi:MAG TPA: bifunctional 5,10-methylenetetrahydrofolate dehydrogenase/5,10-methenyltetrahydrofolate cyclohydrolase [Candidatus Nanoarchaeia archaeon]|nr:bifunctional 5,10-methylenetetrahydrofolate dehydrogenase/5,10-methenyltetrahydrofolate cyclohydrolase [Candidatus Nanoarchaeia archaeon]